SSFGTNTPHKNIWVPGFVIKKYPVTNQDYMQFLNDLVQQGHEDQAMQHVPKELFNIQRDRGAPVYGRDPDGRFILVPDTEGDLWDPLWPVLLITWHSACSYASWYAGGKPSWRLPYELEWEKAARGVDGRLYPWGNTFDESRCCNLHSSKGRQLPSTIYEFPVDKSPYGVRGLMGNSSEWQRDPFHTKPQMLWGTEEEMEPKERICRGNSWINQPSQIRLNRRLSNVSHARLTSLGFRIALPVTAFIRSEDDVSSI
ncbi:MAG: SUMF1/EgtB/PvdO family nonheme iron enzyme, partial [Myxococcota bacterium]|nr:SUMF1/EgtB/PvdO family nonheme iron enzyme [Myxococcota bacterium]